MISTSATLSTQEVDQLKIIRDKFSLNTSSTIRFTLKMIENIDLESYIDRSERSKEIERDIVHFSISEDIYSNLSFLSDNYETSRSKIIGAAILAFDNQDLNKLK